VLDVVSRETTAGAWLRGCIIFAGLIIVGFMGLIVPFLVDARHWWPRKVRKTTDASKL
jgi:hypothetical protein